MKKIIGIILLIPSLFFAESIHNERLMFMADSDRNMLSVKDSGTGREWIARFDSCAGTSGSDGWQHITKPEYRLFNLKDVEKAGSSLLKLTVEDSGSGQQYFLDAALDGNTLSFELYTDDPALPLTCVGLPPLFSTRLDDGHLVFCDRSSGVLKGQSDMKGYADWILSTYANTSCLDMPWLGVVDLANGDGLMILFETPHCSAMHLKKTPDGIWPQPLWQGSMGTMAFRRRISYHFSDGGGYVALAGMYRDHQKEQGRLKTLAQKAAGRPDVMRLAGSPPIWGDGDVFEFLHDARNLGVTRATFCNAERGGRGRADLEKLNEMGYLTLRYDSYSDILEGETWFQRDNIQKTARVVRPGGGLVKGWRTLEGLQYYSRSSAYALNAAQTYSKALIEDVGFNAHFIDVMCAMDVAEDYHPEHTFDRFQDMRNKLEVLKYYTGKGLVLGTEHGNDWAVDEVDYTEGSLSGALWWTAGDNKNGWNPGHLRSPKSLDDFSPLYLKYGVSPKNRIPLWQLVYHDCSDSTWYWGDSPGWFYELAPEISAQKDLTAMLYGASSLFWRDDFRGYGWPKNQKRFMESYYLTAKFHEAVFGHQMVSHEFVTADRLVQKTKFDNGAEVWVNYGETPVDIRVKGQTRMLAPMGFYAHASGTEQGRLIEGGAAVTFIKTDGFYWCRSDQRRASDALSVDGKIVLFRLDKTRWNLLFRPAQPQGRIDLDAVRAFIGQENITLSSLSGEWEVGDVVELDAGGPAVLDGGNYAVKLAESN
ncbi:glycoside hydrolase [Tichowtungia aerotolerans]|uniref:Uncharacterized protein n=1 Tax=Tichowtungia aerotolerans TaxID=2697043 RepID=A0A6P1MCA8_9BACT|nr:glycoside hydrolase [Tichowtungia aerotolerans]QHI68715.1 hypothetical protein GT409_04385 [Tichowtungia aerotolerans]